jgi:uncharacterized protein YndB with AHSA1/START domain
MKMKTIKNTVHINASKEKVWEVLTKDHYTRQWYAKFKEGSHAVTNWKKGSKALFLDADSNGMAAKVVENKPAESLILEFTGVVTKGKEDYESDMARQVFGGHESYRLSEKDGKTQLDTEADMDEGMYDMMAESWKKALQKLVELAEN